MLLLALFLPPLALYLIVLGWINRRPRPVMMGGTWDFAGVLFAVSGFVLVGGPAFLGSLDEQSRLFWLLGETEPARAGRDNGAFWIAVRLFYFVVVAGGAAVLLWRSRRLTSIYNVDPRRSSPPWNRPFVAPRRSRHFCRHGETLRRVVTADAPIRPNPCRRPVAVAPGRHGAARGRLPPDAARHAALGPGRRPAAPRGRARTAAGAGGGPPPEQEPLLGWMLSMLGVSLFFFALFGAAFAVLHNLLPALTTAHGRLASG